MRYVSSSRPYLASRQAVQPPRRRLGRAITVVVLGLVVIAAVSTVMARSMWHKKPPADAKVAGVSAARAEASHRQADAAVSAPKRNYCAGNDDPHLIRISVSQRHMWACSGPKQVYESTAITGMEKSEENLTPRGTSHVYAKEEKRYLDGSDGAGSWHRYVYYWMPFLYNQYGAYGFHDATWRKDSEFGTVSPYSDKASHGCVEVPLAAMQWLYEWAPIGTTVRVED